MKKKDTQQENEGVFRTLITFISVPLIKLISDSTIMGSSRPS